MMLVLWKAAVEAMDGAKGLTTKGRADRESRDDRRGRTEEERRQFILDEGRPETLGRRTKTEDVIPDDRGVAAGGIRRRLDGIAEEERPG